VIPACAAVVATAAVTSTADRHRTTRPVRPSPPTRGAAILGPSRVHGRASWPGSTIPRARAYMRRLPQARTTIRPAACSSSTFSQTNTFLLVAASAAVRTTHSPGAAVFYANRSHYPPWIAVLTQPSVELPHESAALGQPSGRVPRASKKKWASGNAPSGHISSNRRPQAGSELRWSQAERGSWSFRPSCKTFVAC